MDKPTYILSSAALSNYMRGSYSYILMNCNLSTTGIVADACMEHCHDITIKEFSATEIEDFSRYCSLNEGLISVGFKDSSAIYYSSISNYALVVDDRITEKVCEQLDVRYVLWDTLSKRILDLDQSGTPNNDSINKGKGRAFAAGNHTYTCATKNIQLMTG